MLRFGLEAALARSATDTRIFVWLESDVFHDIVIGCIVLAVAAHSLTSLFERSPAQNIRPPIGTSRSGISSTTAPLVSGTPSVKNLRHDGPICFGGKLTTATTRRFISCSFA